MDVNNEKYALFIGRWQPFHNGHKYLIDEAIAKGEKVCVAVRDTKISEKDPYSAEERTEMIRRVYGKDVKVITIPDISSINIGRKVGYDVNRLDAPEHISKISGTNIRAGADNSLPAAVAEYLKTLEYRKNKGNNS